MLPKIPNKIQTDAKSSMPAETSHPASSLQDDGKFLYRYCIEISV